MPILSTLSVACARAFGFGSGDLFAGAALALDFDETTTLDSRITFTRATNGTYFDSSGVLQTASSGAARFDHRLESGVWVNKGLLIEEQRTNSLVYSEELNQNALGQWFLTSATISANSVSAPDGNTTADRIVPTATSAAHGAGQSISITSGVTYSLSFFAKAGEYSNIYIGRSTGSAFPTSVSGSPAYFDLTNGTLVGTPAAAWTQTIEDVGDGWYRIMAVVTATSTASDGLAIRIIDDSGNITFTGDTGKGLYVWGAQLEVGAFPTSYIKTTTASVTRNADYAEMTGTDLTDWYNATEGSVFWQGDTVENPVTSGTGLSPFSFNSGTAADRLQQSIVASGSNNVLRTVVTDSLAEQASYDITFSLTLNQTIKGSFAYKANDFASSIDGSAVATDTSGSIPTISQANIGSINSAISSMNGHIAKFYFWNTRKSNSFLQNITS